MRTGLIICDSISGNAFGTYQDTSSPNGVFASSGLTYTAYQPMSLYTYSAAYFTTKPTAHQDNFMEFNYFSFVIRNEAQTAMISDYDISHWDNGDKLKIAISQTANDGMGYQYLLGEFIMTFPIFSYLPASNKARISNIELYYHIKPTYTNSGGYFGMMMNLDFIGLTISYDSTSGFFFALG